LAELKEAEVLCTAVQEIAAPADRDTAAAKEWAELDSKVRHAIEALSAYAVRLNDTLQRRRDPDKGVREREIITELQTHFAELQTAMHSLTASVEPMSKTRSVRSDKKIAKAIKWLVVGAEQL